MGLRAQAALGLALGKDLPYTSPEQSVRSPPLGITKA